MSKAITLTELLSELAALPELQDDNLEIYWNETWDERKWSPVENRAGTSVPFYSSVRLHVEPMYFQGDEVGFVSVTRKNRVYRANVETVGELHDQPARV